MSGLLKLAKRFEKFCQQNREDDETIYNELLETLSEIEKFVIVLRKQLIVMQSFEEKASFVHNFTHIILEARDAILGLIQLLQHRTKIKDLDIEGSNYDFGEEKSLKPEKFKTY